MADIEPQIHPLVDALNQTGIVRTFSSCEGHFSPAEQTLVDRNHAEVRFIPNEHVPIHKVEALLTYLLTRFKIRHGLIPINVIGSKRYTPMDEATVEETFVLELRPFNRFDSSDRKRADTDRAIQQVIQLINAYQS